MTTRPPRGPLGAVLDNPILRKCTRSRVRLSHMLSWGTVVFTVTAALSAGVYFTGTERELLSVREAARAVILPVLIIQAVLVMGLGTGAVAAGIAVERDSGNIDYHRMTPMSPTAKILGFLVGLPMRHYFLFAVTLPFLLFGVVVGDFPLAKIGLFYLVFASSVLTYHFTGMTVGLLAKRPWQAALFSTGSLFVLYFILPNLSRLGVTFFEFLTIRPTLFGMVMEEIEAARPGMGAAAQQAVSGLDSFRPVPFFDTTLHPITFTLLVQVFLIVLMFAIVRRKWISPDNHPLSKVQGVLAYLGVLFFLGASIWPDITNAAVFEELIRNFGSDAREEAPEIFFVLLVISAVICGTSCLGVLAATTPSVHTIRAGVRRTRKLGLPRIGFNQDAASSLPVAVAAVLATLAGMLLLLRGAARSGLVIETVSRGEALVLPMLLFGFCVLFTQGVMERISSRAAAIALFLTWGPPLFAGAIIAGAFDRPELGMYIMSPCPPASMSFTLINLFDQSALGTSAEFGPADNEFDHLALARTGVVGYGLAAVAIQVERFRWSRRLQAAA